MTPPLYFTVQDEWRRWGSGGTSNVAHAAGSPLSMPLFIPYAQDESAPSGAVVPLHDLVGCSPVALDVATLAALANRATGTAVPGVPDAVALADASLRRKAVETVAQVLRLGPRDHSFLESRVQAALASRVLGSGELGDRGRRKRRNTDPEVRDRVLTDLRRQKGLQEGLRRKTAVALAARHGVSVSYVYKLAAALRTGVQGTTLSRTQGRIASSMPFLFGSRAKWRDFVYALKALVVFEDTHRTITAMDVASALRQVLLGDLEPPLLAHNQHYRSAVLPLLRKRLHGMAKRCGRHADAVTEGLVYRAWSHDGTREFREDPVLRGKGLAYLRHLQEEEELDTTDIRKEVLAALPLSFKGAQKVYAEAAREDVQRAQSAYVQRMAQGMRRNLLFVDESSIELSATRRAGWSLQGVPCLVREPFTGGRDVKIWAAIRDPQGVRPATSGGGNGAWFAASPAYVLVLPAPESNSALQKLLPLAREAQQAAGKGFSTAVARLRQDDAYLAPWPDAPDNPWPAKDPSLTGQLMRYLGGLAVEERKQLVRLIGQGDPADLPTPTLQLADALQQRYPYDANRLLLMAAADGHLREHLWLHNLFVPPGARGSSRLVGSGRLLLPAREPPSSQERPSAYRGVLAVTTKLPDDVRLTATKLGIPTAAMDETTAGLRLWYRAACHAAEPDHVRRLAVVVEAVTAPYARGAAAQLASTWHDAITRIDSPQGLAALLFLRSADPADVDVRGAMALQLATELGHRMPDPQPYAEADAVLEATFGTLPRNDEQAWDLLRGGMARPHLATSLLLWRESLPQAPPPYLAANALQHLHATVSRARETWFRPPTCGTTGTSNLHPLDELLAARRPVATRGRRDELQLAFGSSQERKNARLALARAGPWNGGRYVLQDAPHAKSPRLRVVFRDPPAPVRLAIAVAYGQQNVAFGGQPSLVSAGDGLVSYSNVTLSYYGSKLDGGTTARLPHAAILRGLLSAATESQRGGAFQGGRRLAQVGVGGSQALRLPLAALREDLYCHYDWDKHLTPRPAGPLLAATVPELREDTVLDEVPTETAMQANKELFLEFVRGIPNPLREGATVVMDNSNLHWKGGRNERDLRDLLGLNTLYTPKYTPQLNPIERLFGFVKPLVRRDLVRGGVLDTFSVSAAAQVAVYQYLTPDGVSGFIDRSKYRDAPVEGEQRTKYIHDVLALLQPGSTMLVGMIQKLKSLLG